MNQHEHISKDIQNLITEIDADIITPASLALELQARYADTLDPRIQYLSFEHLKSMARKALACRFDADAEDSVSTQGELFSGHLQRRYPMPHKRGQEPAYKNLEALTRDEVSWNVQMLRKSASARLLHADALEAWGMTNAAAA